MPAGGFGLPDAIPVQTHSVVPCTRVTFDSAWRPGPTGAPVSRRYSCPPLPVADMTNHIKTALPKAASNKLTMNIDKVDTQELHSEVKSLKSELDKTSQQLKHQQQMVKQLMGQLEKEQERRRISEDALVEILTDAHVEIPSYSDECCKIASKKPGFDKIQ